MNKHIWEGWTVQDFIDSLESTFDLIMSGKSFRKPFTSESEIKEWCKTEQPYYKKPIKEVNNYFIKKWKINLQSS